MSLIFLNKYDYVSFGDGMRAQGFDAGLDLEMPGSGGYTDAEIVSAVKDGTLEESVLDTAVERILNIIFKYTDNRQEGRFDLEEGGNIYGRLTNSTQEVLEKRIASLEGGAGALAVASRAATSLPLSTAAFKF